MIDHNHFICHFIFGGHLLNIPKYLDTNVMRGSHVRAESSTRSCQGVVTFVTR